MRNILFIIGNGFDLKCELKTSFSDFFIHLLGKKTFDNFCGKKFDTQNYQFIEILNYFYLIANDDNKKDFKWFKDNIFLILCLVHMHNQSCMVNNINWFDLETYLFDLIQKDYKISAQYLSDLNNICKCACNNGNNEAFLIKQKSEWLSEKLLPKISHDILLKSVSDFEWKFNKYIINTVKPYDTSKFYISKASNLINDIFVKIGLANLEKNNENVTYIPSFKKEDVRIYLINFNYTNPFNCNEFKKIYDFKEQNIWNIHGRASILNNFETKIHTSNKSKIIIPNSPPCIIGIDDTSIRCNNNIYFFTKSFKIAHRLLNVEASIHTNSANDRLFTLPPQNEQLDIVIYGHSLNENDYSYFHAIFDRYNLCNNPDVRIIICYSKNYKTFQPYLSFSSVYRLVKKYGNSMIAKEQGKNLFSRLILENRLLLREIE